MKKGEGGFSFVEFIIVIAIMAILVGLLAPQYIKYIEKTNKAKDDHTADEILKVAEIITSDSDYSGFINPNDYIHFGIDGITTNNSNLQNRVFDNLMGNWRTAKVISNYYKGKYFEVKFYIDSDDNKTAIQNGWKNVT